MEDQTWTLLSNELMIKHLYSTFILPLWHTLSFHTGTVRSPNLQVSRPSLMKWAPSSWTSERIADSLAETQADSVEPRGSRQYLLYLAISCDVTVLRPQVANQISSVSSTHCVCPRNLLSVAFFWGPCDHSKTRGNRSTSGWSKWRRHLAMQTEWFSLRDCLR